MAPDRADRRGDHGLLTVGQGQREVLAIVVGEGEPLVVPKIDEIDERIDISDAEWRAWSKRINHDGDRRPEFITGGTGVS